MKIHQLQASYQVEQDRVLVRLNTHSGEELRLWLTRRLIKNLFPHIKKVATLLTEAHAPQVSHDGADSTALAQFRRQESLQQADFNTPFSTQATALPMGTEPLLATTVHVTTCENGTLRIGFEEKIPSQPQGRSFEITLDPPLLHGLMHLLEQVIKHADWDIQLLQLTPPTHDTPVVDAFMVAEPPKYLN